MATEAIETETKIPCQGCGEQLSPDRVLPLGGGLFCGPCYEDGAHAIRVAEALSSAGFQLKPRAA